MQCRATAISGVLLGSIAAASSLCAQELFRADFEWADTGEWSAAQPPRCDRIDAFSRGIEPTAWVHVATWGDDIDGDGTLGNPYQSIARGVADAAPGTAVRIQPGTYAGGLYLANITGSDTAPIWIGGAPGEPRPVISGGTSGLQLSRASYVVVHDLEIAGASANGLNADDGGDAANPLASHHLLFRRLNIHDIGAGGNEDCLKLSGISDYWVLDSDIARCGSGGSGVDHVGCHRGLLARNRFTDAGSNAVQTKGGSDDIEIRWNRISGTGDRALNLGGSTGFAYFRPPLSTIAANAEARDIRLISNTIEGSGASVAYVGCVACVVAHNTIVDPDDWIVRILQETVSDATYTFEACRDGVFTNNIVSFNHGALSTYVNIGGNTGPDTFTFAHNLWYAWDDPTRSEPTLPVSESNGLYGLDPQLATDFSIGTASPASAAGQPTPWTTGDFTGRCYAAIPSLGAHQAR